MNKSTKNELIKFYEYPSTIYYGCTGVSSSLSRNANVWAYQHIDHTSIRKSSFEALCQAMKEIGIETPHGFGKVETNKKFKGVIIKPSGLVSIRTKSPLDLSDENISFQFRKESISSFTRAMNNAIKVKNVIHDQQLIIKTLRKELHLSKDL